MNSKSIKAHGATGALLASLAVTAAVRGADAYFDINGATAGSGATAAGTTAWDTTTTGVWSVDSTGASGTAFWINGDSAVFSAGTDAANVRTLTNAGVIVDNLTQEEGRIQINAGTLTLADASMTIDTQTRVSGDYDIRINSVIANSGAGASGIIKNGAGMLMLTGNNTFSGGFTLNAGTVNFENQNSAFGTGTITLAGGNFAKTWGTAITIGNALNVTGTVNVGVVQGSANNMTLTGAWQAGDASAVFNVGNAAINGFAVQSTTIFAAGDVSAFTGTFAHNTLASGGNRLRFGTNVGSNGTTPTLSTIDASRAKFLLSGSTTGNNSVDMGDGRYGTFKMGELAGTGGNLRAGWTGGNGNNTTFEVGSLGTASRFAGALLDNLNTNIAGQTGGRTALNKVGSGALELALAGGSSYSGGTTLTAGTLLAGNTSGSATGTGLVTVNGGRLGGSGIIAPTGTNGINVTTGVISPGGAVSATTGGSFNNTIGNLSFNLGGTSGTIAIGGSVGFEFTLGSAGASLASFGTSDLVTLLGVSASDFGFSGSTIDFGGTGELGYYKLFNTSLDETTWSGLTFDSVTGLVSGGLTASNLGSGLTGKLVVGTAGNGGDLGDIYLQAVPEPGAALIGGAGLLLLFRRRRIESR